MSRLEKLAEVFYTYVGDRQPIADALELDVDTVDVVYHYWLLKRKVAAHVFHIAHSHTCAYLRSALMVWYGTETVTVLRGTLVSSS